LTHFKSKKPTLAIALIILIPLVLVPTGVKAQTKTIIVPDDYSTITAAIANATDGDTIFVKKGTYEIAENSITINKTLSIIGEDQTDTKIVFSLDTRVGIEFLFSSKKQ
jgi:pectin methylesterase-like acyl-CoA thioesterase